METLPNIPLLKVTQQDIDVTRQFFNVDTKRINESLDAVEEWIKKQDHLVEGSKYMSRNYLEKIFLLSRASTEKMKLKLEKVLTIRSLMPEICLDKTPSEFENLYNCVRFLPLPKMIPKEGIRVTVAQLVPDKIDEFSLLSYFRFVNMMGEYRLHYEYNISDRYIIDMNHVSVISKINPILLKKSDVISATYGIKIAGMHIVNAPPFIDTFMRLMKQTMREKVASRLHLHNSYEDLHEFIPKEILPEDFGGDELSMLKLSEQWKEHWTTKEAIKLVEESNKIISDESKRSTVKFNEEYLGMPGSFRSLSVD